MLDGRDCGNDRPKDQKQQGKFSHALHYGVNGEPRAIARFRYQMMESEMRVRAVTPVFFLLSLGFLAGGYDICLGAKDSGLKTGSVSSLDTD